MHFKIGKIYVLVGTMYKVVSADTISELRHIDFGDNSSFNSRTGMFTFGNDSYYQVSRKKEKIKKVLKEIRRVVV